MEAVVVAGEEALRELRENGCTTRRHLLPSCFRYQDLGTLCVPYLPLELSALQEVTTLAVPIRICAGFPWEQGQDRVQVTGRKTPRPAGESGF